ncbi:ATP-binding protein [Phaeobacter marinintestinus]|uniref:ATP-binding protein n=1 Tax=Falsiphaeobacter marinintestinus TaxID=1492905 RepID=UPI0011B48CB9|nr:AAA family ATPase [Phaeobacter marinintestinus]
MVYSFDAFELDPEMRELRNRGRVVAVSPKAFDVLIFLVERRDRLVTKAELLDAFWPPNVSEAALQTTMSLVRKALRDGAEGDVLVKTHHGLGFRFVGVIEHDGAEDPGPSDAEAKPLQEQRLVAKLFVRFEGDQGQTGAKDAFLAMARDRIEADHGQLMHMMIDGFSAVFGRDLLFEDVARRAVSCGDDILIAPEADDLRAAGTSVSIGIAAGLIPVLHPEAETDWVLPSGIEHAASDLSRQAPPGSIVITDEVRAQLGDEVDTVPAPLGHRVVTAPQSRAGIPARPLKRQTRFVGREAEMAFLTSGLDRLTGGEGQAVVLSGPAGIGKSRLTAEFLAVTAQRGVGLRKLQCLPRTTNTTLAPVRDLCLSLDPERALQIAKDDIDTALLSELFDDAVQSGTALDHLSDHERQHRRFEVIDRLVFAACSDGPLVIVFEDVHWIDSTSHAYLDALIRQIDRHPVFLLLTTRPVEGRALSETVLPLSPLGHGDSLSLLREMSDLSDQVADTLVGRASGNPFFLEELALAAQGGADPGTELPDTVQAVIAVRVGALDDRSRQILFVIAVAGPGVSANMLADLLGLDVDALNADLDRLVQMGFVLVDGGGITYRHMLIHDTAYRMIAPADRRQMHLKIAQYLETASAPRPETLAWHFQEAGETETAVTLWTHASNAALHRSAMEEAVAFARDGLALLEGDAIWTEARELKLQLALAPALTVLSGFGAAEVGATYRRARKLSQTGGSFKSQVRALVGLWIHTWVAGQLDDALDHARELLVMAAQVDDAALTLQANSSMGEVLMHKGRLEESLQYLEAGLAAIGNAAPSTYPAQNSAVACASYAAWVAAMLGRSDKARGFWKLSETLALANENAYAAAIHYALCAEYFFFERDVSGCLEYGEKAVEISRKHDFPFWLGTGLVMQGWALGQRGQVEAGIAAADEGIAVFEATDAGVQLANWYGVRAEILLAAGAIAAGVAAAEIAIARADATGDVYFLPRIHATLARLYARSGDADLSARHLAKADRLARKSGLVTRAMCQDDQV